MNQIEKANNSAKELVFVDAYYRDLLRQKIKARSLIKDALQEIVKQQYLVNKEIYLIDEQLERFYSSNFHVYQYDIQLTKDCESLERNKEKAKKDAVELRELYLIYSGVYNDLNNEIEFVESFF